MSAQPIATPQDVVFDVSHVTLRFGGVTSLNDVSLQMFRGEILAVIGPNGAGKTSLFNSLTGVYTPQEGSIMLAARPGVIVVRQPKTSTNPDTARLVYAAIRARYAYAGTVKNGEMRHHLYRLR